MRTCPAPGFGISRSTISKSPPALEICAAFIGAIPTLVVAIHPPIHLRPRSKVPYCWHVKRGKITNCALLGHLETDFQSDRGAERKACGAIYRAAKVLVFPKTSCSHSEAPSATFGWSRTFPQVTTQPPRRTIRVTLSRSE